MRGSVVCWMVLGCTAQNVEWNLQMEHVKDLRAGECAGGCRDKAVPGIDLACHPLGRCVPPSATRHARAAELHMQIVRGLSCIRKELGADPYLVVVDILHAALKAISRQGTCKEVARQVSSCEQPKCYMAYYNGIEMQHCHALLHACGSIGRSSQQRRHVRHLPRSRLVRLKVCGAGSTTARHLHVAGVGWNLNASGMLDGPHWGMQQEADGHIVQVQLPHTAGDEDLIWGEPQCAWCLACAALPPGVDHTTVLGRDRALAV